MPGINFIPLEQLDKFWPLAEPLVQEALDAVPCYLSKDNIKDFLFSGKQQLWYLDTPGIFITQIEELPMARVCWIALCAGENIVDMFDKLGPSIEDWARANECDVILVAGRFGWTKVLKHKGYRPQGVVLVREI